MNSPTAPVRHLASVTSMLDSIRLQRSVLANVDADAALAALAPLRAAVRLVLIDPPYNRRTRFHHYDDNTPRDEWAEERRRHLKALHPMLCEDGSLWMHIDDAEMPRARSMLDSVFGPENFVATIVWQKTVSRDNRTDISTTHEYVLVYAKNHKAFRGFRAKLPATDEQVDRYRNPDNDPRGPWTSGDLTAKAGPGRRKAQFYDIVLPSGRVVRPATGTAWRFTRERFDEFVADGRVDFGAGDKMPRLKRFLSEVDPGLVPDTWWAGNQVGTADTAKRHLKTLFPTLTPFETPKPEALAARVMRIASRPGDLVLDCYAGSGTTAAVAHKLGRRWVAIEREQRTFTEFVLPRLTLVDNGRDADGLPAEGPLGVGFDVYQPGSQPVREPVDGRGQQGLALETPHAKRKARKDRRASAPDDAVPMLFDS